MLNRFVAGGRLTRDPEMKYTPQGVAVTNFAVAVDRNYKGANGERGVDFFDCVAWRKTAETIANTLTKGRLITLEGRLENRSYEAKDGTKRRVTEVIVDNFNYMDSAKGQEGRGAPPIGSVQEVRDAGYDFPDDLPF